MSEPIVTARPATSGRRLTRRRVGLLAAFLAACAVLAFSFQRLSTGTGTDDLVVTAERGIEQLIPARNDEVLRQAPVGIDLAAGFEGVLAVNGTPIPEDQLVIEPALNTVLFQPGEGREIERLGAGENCVQASYWRSSEGREQAETVSWCFQVT
ncbi:hypothetical protein BH20ACT2_BH20ACT2_24830 [soil metagenome]